MTLKINKETFRLLFYVYCEFGILFFWRTVFCILLIVGKYLISDTVPVAASTVMQFIILLSL